MSLFRKGIFFLFLLLLTPYAQGEVFDTKSCEPLFLVPFKTSKIPPSTADELASEISNRRRLVPEFEFIREEAQRRGLRVWLFGGTAAGYCHYVKWDLLRKKGDKRFYLNRFDYDYSHIYRSTQDLDIVVNGTAQQAENFQETLKTRFPYFMGNKVTPWEVRSLYETAGDKGGLLDDFGFMNQHTDSNSTGMIELTDPPLGQSVVRDLRDWHRTDHSQFLQDITAGTLTFYHSSQHEQTPRAKTGKNPPIFSVIRALIKAFQYDLKITKKDLEVLRKEIENFDPKKELQYGYTGDWIEKHGKKLFQNAVDIEKAWDTLEALGLRKKLISIRNNPSSINSMAWWLNKEPLRQTSIGEGTGRTAGSLGIKIVSHETRDLPAYENITRSHTGTPNVFISRHGVVGESAIYGDGFYTAVGSRGGARTGFTVRFEVDPNAREGTDFIRTYREYSDHENAIEGDFIIWKNRNALRFIPETLDLSPVEYFEFLAEGNTFKPEDRAILLKFKEKLNLRIISGRLSFPEYEEIRNIIQEKLNTSINQQDTVFIEWIKLEGNRLRKSKLEIDSWIKLWKTKSYAIDPVTFFQMIIELSRDTGLETYIQKNWIPSILNQVNVRIGDRILEKCLFSQIPTIRSFGFRALKDRSDHNPTHFSQALQAIMSHNSNPRAWFKSKAHTSELLKLKAAYLAYHPELRKILTESELNEIEPDLLKISFFSLFEKQLNQQFPESIRMESFQFKSIDLPPEGTVVSVGTPPKYEEDWNSEEEDPYHILLNDSFEMQLTPVTQLQWALIMGNNPSQYIHNETTLLINGQQIVVDTNHPVENISWLDIQIFIKRLNELDSIYTYRLPTEAEWEFVRQADKNTPRSEISDPWLHSWTVENSENQIQDVASLRPNRNGIYDLIGNVWQWVQKSPLPPWTQIPTKIDSKNSKPYNMGLLRGGCCAIRLFDAQDIRRLNYLDENQSQSFSGFRLVRTRKKL